MAAAYGSDRVVRVPTVAEAVGTDTRCLSRRQYLSFPPCHRQLVDFTQARATILRHVVTIADAADAKVSSAKVSLVAAGGTGRDARNEIPVRGIQAFRQVRISGPAVPCHDHVKRGGTAGG